MIRDLIKGRFVCWPRRSKRLSIPMFSAEHVRQISACFWPPRISVSASPIPTIIRITMPTVPIMRGGPVLPLIPPNPDFLGGCRYHSLFCVFDRSTQLSCQLHRHLQCHLQRYLLLLPRAHHIGHTRHNSTTASQEDCCYKMRCQTISILLAFQRNS